MRHLLRLAAAFFAAVIAMSCGRRDTFTITCETDRSLQRMIVFSYVDGTGVRQSTIPLEKGKASLTVPVPATTLVSATLADGTYLAECIVSGGDNVKVKFKLDSEGSGQVSKVSVKGSKPTDRLRKFETAYDSLIAAGYSADLNRAVAGYIDSHRDDPVSTVLLLRYFDARDRETGADSLLRLIDTQARPAALLRNYGAVTAPYLNPGDAERVYNFTLLTERDSVKTIRMNAARQNLVAFLSPGDEGSKQTAELRRLWEEHDTLRLQLIDYCLYGDSAQWRAATSRDSVGWIRVWAPGGAGGQAVRRLNIPRQPFYILIDSTGRQIYRGSSLEDARRKAYDNLVKRPQKRVNK